MILQFHSYKATIMFSQYISLLEHTSVNIKIRIWNEIFSTSSDTRRQTYRVFFETVSFLTDKTDQKYWSSFTDSHVACYGPDGPNCRFYFVEKMHFEVWDNLVNQNSTIN